MSLVCGLVRPLGGGLVSDTFVTMHSLHTTPGAVLYPPLQCSYNAGEWCVQLCVAEERVRSCLSGVWAELEWRTENEEAAQRTPAPAPAPASTVGPDSAQQHSGGQTQQPGDNGQLVTMVWIQLQWSQYWHHECWETECELLWLFPLCLWLIVHCSIVTFWSSEALIALLVPPYPVLTLTRAAVARLSPYIRLDVMWSQHNSCSYPGPWLLQCAAHTSSASSNQSTAHSSPPQ